MPISATGKPESGFTLLEMLAVLTLIGFISILAFPQIRYGEEKTKVQMIGKLIQSDLYQVKAEAISSGSLQTLYFDNHGYHFQVGEQAIARDFDGFTLSSKSNIIEEAIEKVDANPQTDETAEPEIKVNRDLEVQVSGAGSCVARQFFWETSHFQGMLDLKQDGTLGWSYETK